MDIHAISADIKGWVKIVRNVLALGLTITCTFGFITFAVGLVANLNSKVYSILGIPEIAILPIILMIFGLIVFVICLIAVLGIALLNNKLLGLFVAMLMLICCVQVGTSIACYTRQDDIPNLIDAAWTLADNLTRVYFEDVFNCCGYNNITDRVASDIDQNVCVANPISSDSENYTIVECAQKLLEPAKRLVLNFFIVSVVFAIVELFVLVITVIIMKKIHRSRVNYIKLNETGANDDLDPFIESSSIDMKLS